MRKGYGSAEVGVALWSGHGVWLRATVVVHLCAVARGGVGRERSSGHRSEQQSKRKSVRESSKSFCFHSAKIKCFHVVGRKKSEKKRRQNFGTFCMSG